MEMKKIAYGILLLAAGLFTTSCLDEDPQYSQNSKIIFSSEENAELALLGCYGYMTANGAYGQMWQEVPLVGSGLAWGQRNGGDENGLASLAVVPGNGLVSSTWKGMYKVIAEVNAFIESMEASSLDETVKTQKLGEARFLRAIAYYNLVSLWGDVPLKLVASSSDGIAIPRTDRVTIFGTIVDDLKAAMNISATSSAGRLNSWAAKAFLGKVYYKMAMLDIDRAANLNNAKTMFDDVYEHADYELEPNLNSLFVPYTQTGAVTNSKEAIIQLNFNAESGVCNNRGSNSRTPQKRNRYQRTITLRADTSTLVKHNLDSKKPIVSATLKGKVYPIEYKVVDANTIRVETRSDERIIITVLPGKRREENKWYQVGMYATRFAMMLRSANIQYSNTSGQFSQTFFQFFLVIVRS